MYRAAAEGRDAARTIARIWRVTLDRLADDPVAGQVLRMLAWYAPTRSPDPAGWAVRLPKPRPRHATRRYSLIRQPV